MQLPKINLPTFKFKTNLGTEVRYRALTMKDEKILLTAAADESKSQDTVIYQVREVLNNCLVNMDISQLRMSEIEELFIKLRSVSVSNTMTLIYTPPESCKEEKCPDEISVGVNLDNCSMISPSGKTFEEAGFKPKNGGYVVMLTDTEGLIMKEPYDYVDQDDAQWDQVLQVFSSDSYVDKSQFTREEYDTFLEGLPSAQIKKIKEFFDCIPIVSLEVNIKCDICGIERKKTVKGLYNFFV